MTTRVMLATRVLILTIGLAAWLYFQWPSLMKGGQGPLSGSPPASPLPPPGPFPVGATLEDPWKFYALASIDGSHGVDNNGDLFVNGDKSTDAKWCSMDNTTRSQKYFLRPPLSQGGGSWDDVIAQQLAAGASICTVKEPSRCLLVEAPAVVVLTGDCAVEGLVVRRGGTVLLAPQPSMTLAIQFAICESGGLIQCGFASEDGRSDARLPKSHSLTIQFVDNPQGFIKAGAACSQYSYKVHTPGVTLSEKGAATQLQCESDHSLDHLGGCVTNVVGPKAFGCLFNGQIHFAGSVPPQAPFRLWSARNGAITSSESFMQSEQISLDNERGGVRTEYPVCWTACVGRLMQGDTVIQTDDDVSGWPVGAQVVVTCHSEAWRAEGAFMSYGDCKYTDEANSSCADPVINFNVEGEATSQRTMSGFGVEVKTILAVSKTSLTVTGLVYNHCAANGPATFDASDKSQVLVGAPVHVGLLTRNIRFCGRDAAQVTQPPVPFQTNISSDSTRLSSTKRVDVMQLMPMGRMNRAAPVRKTLAAAADGPPPPDQWFGQGGSVICDFCAHKGQMGNALYYASETSPPTAVGPYLHNPTPAAFPQSNCATSGPEARGSSLLGDPGHQGLGYILGGTLKFQYGSAVTLDGVELYRMGIPANTGSLGQYSIHFHCAGWGPKFEDFAVEGALRHLRVVNSVNWRSYSRWCVLHGVNFADVSNNVFCVCMGNGVFTEDGTEHHNNIEHNLMTLNIQTGLTARAQKNDLNQNPGGVVGNFGPDGFSSACIWLANTNNFVYRNVLCCNPAYGVGIWAIALNPRSKAAPATHCVGDEALGLPGLIGNSLTSYDNDGRQIFQKLWYPAAMKQHFTEFGGDSEAIGNIKALQQDGAHRGTLQSCPYLAENTVYNMCQFYIEATNESAPWAADFRREAFVESQQFIPWNGTTSGSFIANAAAGLYPEAAASTAQEGLRGVYTTRIFSQNLCYSMQGMCGPLFGGFIWTQSGNTVCIGNCVLGGEYWSSSSSLKNSTINITAMANYAAVHVDTVTNVAVSGSSSPGGGCEGILVSGGKTMLGLTTCTGSRFASPPKNYTNPVQVVCEASNDDPAASWVAFADGLTLKRVQGTLDLWFGGKYTYLDGKTRPPPLRGVKSDLSCCDDLHNSPSSSWCKTPPPEQLYYVFIYNDDSPRTSQKIGINSSDQMTIESWDASLPSFGKDTPCITCQEGGTADPRFKEIYPILRNSYVWERWGKICSYVGVLPYPAPRTLSRKKTTPHASPNAAPAARKSTTPTQSDVAPAARKPTTPAPSFMAPAARKFRSHGWQSAPAFRREYS